MMKKRILLIIAFITFSFSHSQEWEFVGLVSGWNNAFYKPNSYNTAWIKLKKADFSHFGKGWESAVKHDTLHDYTLVL